MAERRPDGPYVYVTSLAKLLVGESSCAWAAWFKAQHDSKSWDSAPSDFDSSTWKLQHTALLERECKRWEDKGHTLSIEHQNWFRLLGKSATLGGRPDLIAWNKNQAIIIDVKSGKPRDFHPVQLQLYLYAFPRAERRRCAGINFTGLVVYPDRELKVEASSITDEFIANAARTIQQLADPDNPAPRVPSWPECRWCDITSRDCSERVEEEAASAEATDDF